MTSAFDSAPEIYNRARPEYPPPLFDDLVGTLPERAAPLRIVEVGPGTGQATGALLARGARVTAVELGSNLAAFLARKFRAQPNLTVVNARFEDAALAEGAWDVVVSATAYHWVAPDARMRKPHALLAPGGVLAVIDTTQVRSDADRGYFKRSHPIYLRYWPDQVYRESPEPDVDPPIFEEIRASGLFEDVRIHRYRWDQVYDADAYIDLVRSYSNTYDLTPEVREQFVRDIRAMVVSEEGGFVLRPLVITLVTGRRIA